MKIRWAKVLRNAALVTIPLVLLVYVGNANFLPFGSIKPYLIDIGNNDVVGNARLLGPFDRVSDSVIIDGVSSRRLEKWGVYFSLENSALSRGSSVTVQVKFKDDFPLDNRFILGARDNEEWSYDWKDIYVPFYQELEDVSLVAQDDLLKVYDVGGIENAEYDNVADFLENPPLYSIIATNDDVDINQKLNIEEWGEIKEDVFSVQEEDTAVIDTALRGPHTLWTYVSNGLLELYLIKRDLNWYAGADNLKITIYSLDGDLLWSTSIADDGNESSNHQLGELQVQSLRLPIMKEGAYKIDLECGSDILITNIEINQEKLVIEDNLYWAGVNPIYFDQSPSFNSTELYFRNTRQGKMSISTAHDPGLQTVSIDNGDYVSEIELDETNAQFEINLDTGVYNLGSEKQDIVIQTDDYFAFSPSAFFIPKRCEVIDLVPSLEWAEQNAHFILVENGDYLEPVNDGDWMIAHATWNIDELFIQNNMLRFCFSIPHLNLEQYEDKSILVDWIKLSVSTAPIWER